ncbi:hypothetical protein [Acinetobacter pittii]|nr:hypothetical protein [Acinetobacter pittii]
MFWYERNKKARYAVIHIGLNQSVIKASDACMKVKKFHTDQAVSH